MATRPRGECCWQREASGSTELLLRCRDDARTLPRLSGRLGKQWSANANVVSMATYADADRVRQTVGPTISSAIDFADGAGGAPRFVIEDDGFPNVVLNALRACLDGGSADGIASIAPLRNRAARER